MSTPFEVGKKLVQLCQQDKSMEAVEQLYSPNVICIEAQGGGNMPAYGKNLKPAEVEALVAFMKTLRPANEPLARDASRPDKPQP